MQPSQGDLFRHRRSGKLWAVDSVFFVAARPSKRPDRPAFVEVVQMYPIGLDPAEGRRFNLDSLARTFHPDPIAG